MTEPQFFSKFPSFFSALIGGGLIGSLLTLSIVEHWEQQREQREALQSLVLVWHSGHIGRHRDQIAEWLLGSEGRELRSLPADEYKTGLQLSVQENPRILVSVLAIAGFFRSIDICIRDDRCDSGRTLAALGPPAREFHDVFGSLLRHLDCEAGYSGTEDPLLRVARRDALPAPDRCRRVNEQMGE